MDKYLITGFSGFVSQHFLTFLENLQKPVAILGLDINEPDFNYHGYQYLQVSFNKIDLLDKVQVDNVIFQFQPNYILHLASFSSVAFSWKHPVTSFSNNTNIFLNLLEQVRSLGLRCRILSIGSSEEYGNVHASDIPLQEEQLLKPVSPYAVARVSQELLSKIYVDGFGMDIVMTRSFNHIGPGQKDIFVISSFAKQLVEIKKHQKEPVLSTGDLTIIRDFLDVRDVVKAYYLLFKHGIKGEVYNICSGKGTSLNEIIVSMANILAIEVQTNINPSLIRPNDNAIIIGSNNKLKSQTNWDIEFSLERSLTDVINYWFEKV